MIRNFKIADIRYDIEGDLTEAISALSKAKAEYESQGYSRLSIDITSYDDYGSTSTDVYLYGYREETAEEIAKRENAELHYKNQQEVRERAQFEALKAKFGEPK